MLNFVRKTLHCLVGAFVNII